MSVTVLHAIKFVSGTKFYKLILKLKNDLRLLKQNLETKEF